MPTAGCLTAWLLLASCAGCRLPLGAQGSTPASQPAGARQDNERLPLSPRAELMSLKLEEVSGARRQFVSATRARRANDDGGQRSPVVARFRRPLANESERERERESSRWRLPMNLGLQSRHAPSKARPALLLYQQQPPSRATSTRQLHFPAPTRAVQERPLKLALNPSRLAHESGQLWAALKLKQIRSLTLARQ